MASNGKVFSLSLRSWPKMVFTWPTALAALAAAVLIPYFPGRERDAAALFLLIFTLNLFVISFEFSRSVVLTLTFAVIAAVTALYFWQERVNWWGQVIHFYSTVDLKVSIPFFYAFAGAYSLSFLSMFLGTRLDYWQVTTDELIHRRGILGGTERYPIVNMKITKEIDDIFEFFLAGAGKLTLRVPGRQQAVVLDNVLGVNRAEKRIEAILGAKKMTPPPLSGVPVFAVGAKA